MDNLISFLNTHKKKHLIFDLDDTITSLHVDWSSLRQEMRNLVHQIDADISAMIPERTGATDALHNLAIKTHGLSAKKIIIELLEAYETSNYSGHTPNNCLLNFIFENKHRYQISVWTSNTRQVVEPVLFELKLTPILYKCITVNEVLLKKPEPDGFGLIHEASTLNHDDYLMIGDSDKDKDAAKASGIDFVRIINKQ